MNEIILRFLNINNPYKGDINKYKRFNNKKKNTMVYDYHIPNKNKNTRSENDMQIDDSK
jgi:hypothetical protein